MGFEGCEIAVVVVTGLDRGGYVCAGVSRDRGLMCFCAAAAEQDRANCILASFC